MTSQMLKWSQRLAEISGGDPVTAEDIAAAEGFLFAIEAGCMGADQVRGLSAAMAVIAAQRRHVH